MSLAPKAEAKSISVGSLRFTSGELFKESSVEL